MPYFDGSDEGVKLRLGTSISFTGNWLYNYPFFILPPNNLQINDASGVAEWGSWIYGFTVSENNASGGLTSVSFNNLLGQCGSDGVGFINLANLASLSFPKLKYTQGSFGVDNAPSLATLSIPNIKIVNGVFSLGNNVGLAALQHLSAPSLQFAQGGVTVNLCGALLDISMPQLQTCYLNGIFVIGCPLVTSIDFSGLAHCGGGGTVILCASLAALTTISIGAVGVTKFISGNVDLSGCALTQASVDGVLAVIASLDGTGGTTSWGAGLQLSLNGGTNSTPSAAGLANKAIIVGRGGVVLNN